MKLVRLAGVEPATLGLEVREGTAWWCDTEHAAV